MLNYLITFQSYHTNDVIKEKVNSISFLCKSGHCFINQQRLESNQILAISGNAGEENYQDYKIMFDDPNAATNNVLVTLKKYV